MFDRLVRAIWPSLRNRSLQAKERMGPDSGVADTVARAPILDGCPYVRSDSTNIEATWRKYGWLPLSERPKPVNVTAIERKKKA